MSAPQPIIYTPYTAQELLDCGWVLRVRRAVLDYGHAVRIGKNTIESQNINKPDHWMPIMLPNGGTKLTDTAQCAIVMDWIEGVEPIPEPVGDDSCAIREHLPR